jgi:hypothetical protein
MTEKALTIQELVKKFPEQFAEARKIGAAEEKREKKKAKK